MLMSLSEVTQAVRSSYVDPAVIEFTGVSTDTRLVSAGDLFVALISPKDNGHRYVNDAILGGASAIIVSEAVEGIGVPAIYVPDTTVAYGQVAHLWREKFDIPIVGVTGSVGKTTTKEMIAAALTPLGSVLKTEANQNSETGVPKALLKLNSEHMAAVIEMGMRGRGQIQALAGIARPTVGVVTVVSDNHIELLGSQDAIADAKGELLEELSPSGVGVLNADDSYFEHLKALSRGRTITFGRSEHANYRITQEVRTGDGWSFELDGAAVHTSSPSRHDITNAAAAIVAAVQCGVELRTAAAALPQYVHAPMRMEVVPVAGWGGLVLNDAYNAAPASTRSALETLFSYKHGRRIAFIGDMKELGSRAESAHRELGELISELGGLDALYTVGELAAGIAGASERYATSAEAAEFVKNDLVLQKGDTVLVKGSRAMAMERVVAALSSRTAGTARKGVDLG